MNDIDPKIPVHLALEKTAGNQAELGRLLGVQRALVNSWVRTEREYLPPLYAYRFVRQFGEVTEAA